MNLSNDILCLLKDAYDIHIHCAPDIIPRSQDVLDLALEASLVGMAGIGIKSHTESTSSLAYILNKLYPNGPKFYSSLVLNPTVGSLNPTAVEAALLSGTDIIYFPTYSIESQVAKVKAGLTKSKYPLPDKDFNGLSILMDNGQVLQEVEQILLLIAKHNAVLATGHLSIEESLKLLAMGSHMGVKRMIATHVSELEPRMSVEHQLEAVSYGAFIEHSFLPAALAENPSFLLETIAEQIHQVGIENVILSSDFGRTGIAKPIEGFGYFLSKFLNLGFTREELHVMVSINPKRLLTKFIT